MSEKGATVTRRGPERKPSRANVTAVTLRMDATLFDEFSDAIDVLRGENGRPMTQREFLEGAVRRELERRRPQLQRARAADRKGAGDAGEANSETGRG
jgi:2-methylcitrate dehydratase PrpD